MKLAILILSSIPFVAVTAIVLSLFFDFKYVAMTYVIGNILFSLYLLNYGAVGIGVMLDIQVPAFAVFFIGMIVGWVFRPLVGEKLSKSSNPYVMNIGRYINRFDD